MSDAGFVIAAWAITALALGGYALRIALRTAAARGEKTLFKHDGDWTAAVKSDDGPSQ